MRRILLASTSPYRKAQLESLGIPFNTAKPAIDEELAKERFVSPLEMAEGLAKLKAESLKSSGTIVIGGDQLISFENEILGKPHTFDQAVEQLLKMQGKTHQILTAVCVCTDEKNYEFVDVTHMTMKSLSKAEVEAYVKLDQPLDCAGSYKIEKNGQLLFEKIETEDFSAIQGLPLIKLAEVLQTLGYEIKKDR